MNIVAFIPFSFWILTVTVLVGFRWLIFSMCSIVVVMIRCSTVGSLEREEMAGTSRTGFEESRGLISEGVLITSFWGTSSWDSTTFSTICSVEVSMTLSTWVSLALFEMTAVDSSVSEMGAGESDEVEDSNGVWSSLVSSTSSRALSMEWVVVPIVTVLLIPYS